MLGQFTNTTLRVNPGNEIILSERAGKGKTQVIHDVAITVKRYEASRMGGEFGEVWIANPNELPNGPKLLEAIKRVPLEASNRANDPLGVLRQIALAPNGGIPLEIGLYEPEVEPLGPGEQRKVAIRLEVDNYQDVDAFSVEFSEFVPPEERAAYREFAEPNP